MSIILDPTKGITNASWTTAGRPIDPVDGQMGFNTTAGTLEWYSTSMAAWVAFNQKPTYQIEYLVVAGGASGARTPNTASAGGGGAGGLLSGSTAIEVGSEYPIVIGAGGAAYQSPLDGGGNAGSNTTAFNLEPIGGGTGGWYNGTEGYQNARSGGSGGGASWNGSNGTTFGAGTLGQGNNGGTCSPDQAGNGGGGGGAGSVGGNGLSDNSRGGAGGDGTDWLSLGTFYAGGGGGGTKTAGTARAPGGSGIGGDGGFGTAIADVTGLPGAVNTGSGGGATGLTNYGTTGTRPSGAGGSGVVIFRYLGTQRGTGGTVTSAGGYTYHTFTSSGTYTA